MRRIASKRLIGGRDVHRLSHRQIVERVTKTLNECDFHGLSQLVRAGRDQRLLQLWERAAEREITRLDSLGRHRPKLRWAETE
jgi:hypothetical protein